MTEPDAATARSSPGPVPMAQIVGATATIPAEDPTSPPQPAPAAGSTATSDVLKEALKPIVALLANVTVVTALLVYFGWRRAETQADRLGIDESVLRMTTREYVLRSVGPVLVLLVGVAVCGLAWMALERRLTPLLCPAPDAGIDPAAPVSRLVRLAVPALGLGWLVLPGLVYLLGFVWPATAFVLFPASIAAGVLLWAYACQVRRDRDRSNDDSRTDDSHSGGGAKEGPSRFALIFVGLLVLVCLFWTASNYAEVLGHRLADDFVHKVDHLPGVVVLSEQRLFLDGPGVDEDSLAGPDNDGALRYRYEGLRLLENTGGRYFLVSDGWTPTDGVVFVLKDDDDTIRLDFVREGR
jgi:hypothetical protein